MLPKNLQKGLCVCVRVCVSAVVTATVLFASQWLQLGFSLLK